MRKRSFLKAVSLLACFSILMLSVPGVIAAERTAKKPTHSVIMKATAMFSTFFHFLNLKTNNDNGTTSSDQTSDDDSVQKVKVTGTVVSMKGPKKGD